MASARKNEIKAILAEYEAARQLNIKELHSAASPAWKKNAAQTDLERIEKHEKLLKKELNQIEEIESGLNAPYVDLSKRGRFKYFDVLIDAATRGVNKYKLGAIDDGYRYNLGDIIKPEWDAETLFAVGFTVLTSISNGTMPRTEKLMKFYFDTTEKSANLGFALAQYDLGNSYETSDKRKAAFWWDKAAKQGLIDAAEKLGRR